MTENYCTLLANAGVFIKLNSKKILIDALHNDRTHPFSYMRENVIDKVIGHDGDFKNIDAAFFTHGHIDHYDDTLVKKFSISHPETQIVSTVLPENVKGHIISQNNEYIDLCGDISVKCGKITHDGAQYKDYTNYSYIISVCGTKILTLGDSGFFPEEIADFIGDEKIDIAFLNFPYLTLSGGRRIIKDIIHTKFIFFNHIPFEYDDKHGYFNAAQNSFKRYSSELPPCKLLNFELQTEYF